MSKPLVCFCIPTIKKPYSQMLASLEASLPFVEEAGFEHVMTSKIGCPYISSARSTMLRQALDAKADIIVFLDHDLSWEPMDLVRLIQTNGEVIAGTYRFKKDEEEYMGSLIPNAQGTPIVREDGCILAHSIPAGFLKITKYAVNLFMREYPELMYGDRFAPHVDLFNHGAIDFVWYGEDYAFAKRWREKCGEIWIVPNLSLTHHTETESYPGNFHEFLLRQPGGSKEVKR